MKIDKKFIQKLWDRQFNTKPSKKVDGFLVFYHPYTCLNRDDGKHGDFGGDTGILVPTINGWICPCCNYTQKFFGTEG